MNNILILASSSPRRKMLLENIGLDFDVIYPLCDEVKKSGEKPEDFVVRISGLKALSVTGEIKGNSYVLSADTVVVTDSQVLGKPKDRTDAERMLRMISGKSHSVITGFSIAGPDSRVLHSESVTTIVRVKALEDWEIEGYIKTDEPMDKAGAYGIQGIGSFLVEEIEGSYTNVVGLPVYNVVESLKKLGILKLF